MQQLNAAVLFAFGFIMRPIGGWLFGHLADQYGRRDALMLSVLLMCFGSLMIAVTPTYASIGIAAPVLLGVARMIQGLSLGGEYGTRSINAVVKDESFPTRVRATGVGLPYAITVSIFGGTAESIALWFESINHCRGW